jgi:hypothetical protein
MAEYDRTRKAYIRERSPRVLQVTSEVSDLGLEACILLLAEFELHVYDLLLLAQIIDHSTKFRELNLGAIGSFALARRAHRGVCGLANASSLRADVVKVLMEHVVLLCQCLAPKRIVTPVRCHILRRTGYDTLPSSEIGDLSVECLSLLAPTTFGSCQFSLCSLCCRPIIALGCLEVMEAPLEVLIDLDSFCMGNDLTRIPFLCGLGATIRVGDNRSE